MLDEREIQKGAKLKSSVKTAEDDLVIRPFISSELDKVKRQIVFYKKKMLESEEKLKALELLQIMAWRD
jgi:hypothetical protein